MDKLKHFSTRKWSKQFILQAISLRVLLFLVENSHKRSDFPRNWGIFAILFGPIEFLVSSIATLGQTVRLFNSERGLLCERRSTVQCMITLKFCIDLYSFDSQQSQNLHHLYPHHHHHRQLPVAAALPCLHRLHIGRLSFNLWLLIKIYDRYIKNDQT